MADNAGLVGIDEAFAAALTELGVATPSETHQDLPSEVAEVEEVFEQAEPARVEQPVEKAEDTEELFEDIIVPEAVVESKVDIDAIIVELPGVEKPVTIRELKDGFLRHKDYTQGKQELARLRQDSATAVQFWEALQADPVGVIQQLAAEAGVIEEGQTPVRKVDFSPLKTAEQVEAEVERRVREAVKAHPRVIEAEATAAVQAVDSEFARIEGSYGVKLGPKSRQVLLETAVQAGTGDLELVFNGLRAVQQKKQSDAAALKGAAPSRPTGHVTHTELTELPGSIEEAFQRALVELGAD